MTQETIERITARFVARHRTGNDEKILNDFVEELARDIAATVFLVVRNAVDEANFAEMSRDERADLSSKLDAFAVSRGCDFALRVRESFSPEGTTEAVAEAERFAAQAYWAELQNLLATVDKSGGRA